MYRFEELTYQNANQTPPLAVAARLWSDIAYAAQRHVSCWYLSRRAPNTAPAVLVLLGVAKERFCPITTMLTVVSPARCSAIRPPFTLPRP